MSFSGKKFRRVRCEGVEELLNATNRKKEIKALLMCSAPTFCFTRIDDTTFNFSLQTPEFLKTRDIRLGEEYAWERLDGSKVLMTYTLEGDNVLKQVVKQPDGKIAHFRREFGDKKASMTISLEGTSVEAKILYELVE